MKLLTGLKLLRDFLGFTLVSIGGTLSAFGILLLIARVALGHEVTPRNSIPAGLCVPS
jgi:hypothetical protein